jgi:serine/threonine protein kinase
MLTAPHDAGCPGCGATNPLYARFCGACGSALSVQSTSIRSEDVPPEQHSSVLPVQSDPDLHLVQTLTIPKDQPAKQDPLPLPEQASSEQPAPPKPQHANVTIEFPHKSTPYDINAGPTPSVRSSQPPSLLKDRYQVLKKLGAGGYGTVYKAQDTEFGGRMVAIKEMSQRELDGKDKAEAIEAFKKEAFMLAPLTHPNLPSIYDYFTENDRSYLVMSFIEGETLEEYLNRSPGGKLPVDKVLMIGTQLASVLSYLHRRNPPIIFRDLKPANIMRILDGQIYLIDFGIARHFKVGQLKDTIALGSPGYAAPEQYGRAQSTPQTDVYSLGATLHHMLTGIDPSENPFSHAPLDLPHHPQLSILISCMLDMDPRKRPASMGNIKRELQRIISGRSYPSGHPLYNPLKPSVVQSSQPHHARGRLWPSLAAPRVPVGYEHRERGIRR